MNRAELESYILETYNAETDRPWAKYPNFQVFRHSGSKKWFALVMDLPRQRLGLEGEGTVEAVNLKCGPLLAGSLRAEPGFFPAYHMNKESWITAVLDGAVPAEKLRPLLDMSFDLTAPKVKKRKNSAKTP